MAIAIPIPEKLLSFLSEKVAPIIKLETRKILNIPELVEDIENEADIANFFLRKIEEKEERENERIKNKVRELRELVFKIEDISDEYKVVGQQLIYHQFGGNEYNGCFIGIHEFLQQQSTKFSEFRDKHKIACRIVKIKKAMEKLKGSENNYEKSIFTHTQDSEDSDIDDFEEQKRRLKKKINDPGYCPLYKDEEELVGFMEYKKQLLEKLDLEKKNYCQQFVLAVWGQAGVGKTTLVRKMYEDEDVKKNFCCIAWITATKPHKKVCLLKCLFKQFISTSQETCQSDEFSEDKVQKLEDDEVIITNRLRKFLTSHNPNCNKNRYFVVLDDVSENEELSRIIKAALVPKERQGGRLILTTKSESIAKYWKTLSSHGETHNLSVLSGKDSKDLFDKVAFGNNGKCPLKLEGLRNNIVEECDGFPFLIEKVASYFSNSDKWIELYQNFQINPLRARNKRVLLSNYHDMPYHLKPCFLYLCIFPKGHVLHRMRIVRLWIAEGFVQPKGHSTYEEAAEEYLNELVQRGMVHVVRKDDTGRFREYQLPRMWHQIMLPKLADLSFCKVLSKNNSFTTNNQCRRLSIHTDTHDTFIPTSVRSILSFVEPKIFPISWSSPFHESSFRLKVLDLQNANFEDIPRVLGKLWNLRYLSLQNTKVKIIPNTIGGLFNLETLDLKQTNVKNLPIQVNRLKKLRHLLVGRCTSKRIYPVKIDGRVFESLVDLQKLVYLNASPKNVVSELGKLRQLRRLGIERLSCEDSQNLCNCFKNMQFLRSLRITMLPNENIDLRMEDDQALPFLERLYLVGKLEGNELPKWIVQLKHLVKIMLKNSRFNKNPLAQLRFMKELLVLELDNPFMPQDDNNSKKVANGGNSVLDYCRLDTPVVIQKYRYQGQVKENKCSVNNLYGGRSIEFGKVLDFGQTTGFPKLQELRIKNMNKLESMVAKSSKVLPQLQRVLYENCPKLMTEDRNLPKQMKGIVHEMSK